MRFAHSHSLSLSFSLPLSFHLSFVHPSLPSRSLSRKITHEKWTFTMWFNTNACLSLSRDQGTPREELQFLFIGIQRHLSWKSQWKNLRNIFFNFYKRTIIYDSKSFFYIYITKQVGSRKADTSNFSSIISINLQFNSLIRMLEERFLDRARFHFFLYSLRSTSST